MEEELSLFNALRTQRAIRPDEAIARIITAATWAPSPGNRQPWHFTVSRSMRWVVPQTGR